MLRQTKWQKPRNKRNVYRKPYGKIGLAQLTPVHAEPVLPSEGGMYAVRGKFDAVPIPLAMESDVKLRVQTVFVPAVAIYATLNPDDENAGVDDLYRKRLQNLEEPFELEEAGVISNLCDIKPFKAQDGKLMVSSAIRGGHIAAVNYLRRDAYRKATQIDVTEQEGLDHDQVTPGLLSSTVLNRFGGVLSPDDNINGAISLNGDIPVKGIGRHTSHTAAFTSNALIRETEGESVFENYVNSGISGEMRIETDEEGRPQIYADFQAGDVSLDQFRQAMQREKFTRQMAQILDAYPEYGEEIILRSAMGLSIETGKMPFKLYEAEKQMNVFKQRPMDGPSMGEVKSFISAEVAHAVMVPKTEFGGVVYTFVTVCPEERMAAQPHPIGTRGLGTFNFEADAMVEDPERIVVRQLDNNADDAVIDKDAMWVGHNHLYRNYTSSGFRQDIDVTTLDAQSVVFEYDIPTSVGPDNVMYSLNEVNAYAFNGGLTGADALNDLVDYRIEAQFIAATPIVYGPSPIEKIDAIEDYNIFGEGDFSDYDLFLSEQNDNDQQVVSDPVQISSPI